MSFVVNAVAGPSRTRASRTVLCAAGAVQHQCAQRRGAADGPRRRPDDKELTPEELFAASMAMANNAYKAKSRKLNRWDPHSIGQMNFEAWRDTVGKHFKKTYKGQPKGKARWLGFSVPFPSNPTFSPPPPLSHDLMSIINAELKHSKKTVGQIATQYSVSKERIEAIRKLKRVEEEYWFHGLTRYRGFQRGMETLLGVPQLPKGEDAAKARREEEIDRVSHPSTDAEIEEAERGKLGSFGNLREQADSQPLEKESWAFVSEAEKVSGTSAAEEAMADALEPAPRPPKPDHPSNYNKPSKQVFRFVDTSKTSPKA